MHTLTDALLDISYVRRSVPEWYTAYAETLRIRIILPTSFATERCRNGSLHKPQVPLELPYALKRTLCAPLEHPAEVPSEHRTAISHRERYPFRQLA